MTGVVAWVTVTPALVIMAVSFVLGALLGFQPVVTLQLPLAVSVHFIVPASV